MTVVKLHGATAVGNVTVAPETFRCWQSPTCGHLLSWRSPNDSTERSVLLARMRRLDVSTAEKDVGTSATTSQAAHSRARLAVSQPSANSTTDADAECIR